MIDLDNPELQNALQIIQFTRRSLSLPERRGRVNLLFTLYSRQYQEETYHSCPNRHCGHQRRRKHAPQLFKLPFHPLLPNDSMYSVRNIRNTLKYNSEKIKIIREIELIIIDEISMVRADIIDFLDKILRVYCRNMREPFGASSCFWWAISSSWSLW